MMVRPGDVLHDPTSGRRLIFGRTSSQTGGRLIEYTLHYRGREQHAGPRVDADREHLVEVFRGRLVASVGGRLQQLQPGDVLLITPGMPHAIWNAFDAPAAAVWQTLPALDTELRLTATYVIRRIDPRRPG
jgi:uncharacterized RmlC-like cupin family protein